MSEVTKGQIDPAHYGPVGDAARNIASYCEGGARVHVYTAAFEALATAEAEIAALREALKPFADCCDQIEDTEDDEEWAKFRLLIKDYRAARADLEGRSHD